MSVTVWGFCGIIIRMNTKILSLLAGVHAGIAELEAPVADDGILGVDAEIAGAAPGKGKPRRQHRE